MLKRNSIVLGFLFLFFSLFLNSDQTYSQPELERLGTDERGTYNIAFYNFGDPDKLNIEVSIIGYVKNPGRYLIPSGSKFLDLVSYAGGPLVDAELKDIRILRLKNDTLGIYANNVINLDYDQLFWQKQVNISTFDSDPVLMPGDFVVFPGEPRLFFRDQLSIILAISSTLISLAILFITILKN